MEGGIREKPMIVPAKKETHDSLFGIGFYIRESRKSLSLEFIFVFLFMEIRSSLSSLNYIEDGMELLRSFLQVSFCFTNYYFSRYILV